MTVPDPTDLADPSVYYNPNMVAVEGETWGGGVFGSTWSPGYDGQIEVINNSDNFPAASRLVYSSIAAGGALAPVGNFNQQNMNWSKYNLNSSWNELTPNASGTELFEANPWNIGITSLSMPNTGIYRLDLQAVIQPSGASFTGNLNVYIDPTSSTQPTPTSPGAYRYAFPVTTANGTTNQNKRSFRYSLWYTPNSSITVSSPGIAIYLSAIQGQAKAIQVQAPGASFGLGSYLNVASFQK